ncbi:MAG TPA: hypothetical protein EYG38_01085, partial [Verrucomicrobia bacterium]|nr:hypothetical protein [Verrucomicrobiota bacterium]
MPVRIYEIAKIVGVESKAVLVKAKELGIPTAKSPSSSLDKITAEYLVEQMGGSMDAASLPKPAVKSSAKKKTTKAKAKKTPAKKTTKKVTDLKKEAPKKAAKPAAKSKAKSKTNSETDDPKKDPAPLDPEETTVAETVSEPTAVESPTAEP